MTSSTDRLSDFKIQSNAEPHVREVQRAVLRAVAYSDVFDYPLTIDEIHRYLAGVRADRSTLDAVLANGSMFPRPLSQCDGYVTLPGREHLVETRRERAALSSDLWRHARQYGEWISRLPFVRMVAVTGELAVGNVQSRSDIDYFIVTEAGRLWLTRAMVILIVKVAARSGITVCPNYLVTENALVIDSRNLYSAREMAQMVPLCGLDVYHRMRQSNRWVLDYLPNALGPPECVEEQQPPRRAQRLSEAVLRTSLAGRLENWEMTRKIRRFTYEMPPGDEVAFSADWCKGHFDAHGERTLKAYRERLQVVEELLQ